MSRMIALLLLFLAGLSVRAAEDNAVQAVAPYLDEQTFAVVHVDLTRLDFEGVIKHLEKMGAPKNDVEKMTRSAKDLLDTLTRAGIKNAYVIASLSHLPYHPPLIIMPLAEGGTGKGAVKLLLEMGGMKTHEAEGVLVAGSEGGLKRLRELKPVRHPELAASFESAGKGPIRAVLFPGEAVRRALEELIPTFPRELGGGPTTPLTRGFRWASAGVGLVPTSLNLTIQASDETAARAIRGLIASGLKLAGADSEVREAYPDFEKLAAALTPRVQGDALILKLTEEQLVATFAPAVKKVRGAASQAVIANHMKQIGIAFHSYHDVYKSFPAQANHDKQGNPLLSWRVHILPYLGEDRLYKEFRLDEPWDSEHNRKLIKRMPKLYQASAPRLAEEGRTAIVVPAGPGTAFRGKTGLKLMDVRDGTSNTILAVEVEEERAVVWTKPEDLTIDPKNPLRGLRRHDNKAFMALFFDGSLRMLPVSIKVKTLAALFTPDGDEVVELP